MKEPVWKSLAAACCTSAAIVVLGGCAAQAVGRGSTDCNIRVGGSVLNVAADAGFAYRETVASACSGQNQALVKLLLFTDRTDGEAMLDHGSVLLALRDHVGGQRFDSISRSLGDDRKKAIDSLVETAEKLHRATLQTVGRTDRP
jgi:hypothetical protein